MSKTRTERPGKGKSIIDFPSTYIVVDIETTGLSPIYCEIIEISAIKYDGEREIDKFSTLVNPFEEIDPFITSLTGISNDMVKDAPDISEAILKFHSFIGNDILVGYNVGFDINFLYDNLKNCHDMILSNPWINIQRFAKKLLPDLESYAQTNVASYYNISVEGAHRATTDCEITHLLYEQFKKEISMDPDGYEGFKKLFKKKSYPHKQSPQSKDITTNISEFDTSHPLYGKTCVFTGKLEKMIRREAAQLVVDHGGYFEDGITKRTNFLIFGNLDYSKALIKDGKSSKYKKAEKMILNGQDLQILSEDVFYDMVFEDTDK